MGLDGAYVPTIEETVTATHPPVMPYEPVRTGRHPVRVPAAEASSERPHALDAQGIPSDSDHIAETTRKVFRGVLIGLRICAIVALVLVGYFAWAHNWVGNTADAVVTWYSTNVAPHLEVDFVGPEVPTVHDGLVGPMNEASLVTTD